MTLRGVLKNYLERTDEGLTLSAGEGTDIVARAAKASPKLARDLQRVSREATIWCAVMVALVVGLGVLTVALQGTKQIVSALGAGGVGAALLSTWRKKFAADLLVVMLKALPENPKERRLLVKTFLGKI